MEVSPGLGPRTRRRVLTVSLALLAFVLLGAGWYAGRSVLQRRGPANADAGSGMLSSMMQLVIKQTRLWKGDASAPVTIVEFADFQ